MQSAQRYALRIAGLALRETNKTHASKRIVSRETPAVPREGFKMFHVKQCGGSLTATLSCST